VHDDLVLPEPALFPDGQVVTVVLDGRRVSVWWAPDGDVDRVAVREGQVRTWPTADQCAAEAPEGADTDVRSTIDVTPVQDWLRGRRTAVDPTAALDAWNLAGDVAGSTGVPWPDGGRAADRCHAILTAANVPWAFGVEPFRPRWTQSDLRRLREVLSAAVHVLRTEVVRSPRAPRTT
jgi:hypothetical protein